MALASGKCTICLGNFLLEQISALRCGHTFHYECILQWLQTSKTCPECRSSCNERNLIRQLFFNSGDISQLDPGLSRNEEALDRKVFQLCEAQEALRLEQKEHSKTTEELLLVKKQKEKAEALCNQEKRKVKSLTSQLARLEQLELMLQDQQHLRNKLEKYKARLKAADLYSLLSKSGDAEVGEKIDKYVDEKGDPDMQKFFDLIGRQHEDTKKRLNEVQAKLETSQKANLELRVKLEKHKKLNLALKEEVCSLRASSSQTAVNPKLREVLAYSPGGPRSSFGFGLDDDEPFSPSLLKSAVRTRSRPVLHPIVTKAEKPSVVPFLFETEKEVACSSGIPTLKDAVHLPTGSEDDIVEGSHEWDVGIRKPISSVNGKPPKNKKSNGLGGITKEPLRSTLFDLAPKRGFTESSSKGTKKQKSAKNLAPVPLSRFFGKSNRIPQTTLKEIDSSIICLD